MSSSATLDDAAPQAPREGLSVLQRAIAIFTRPGQAWVGLRERAQWWFPVLIMMILAVASSALLYQRAIVPMMSENLDQQVANGQLPADQADRMERFFASPVGMAVSVGPQILAVPIITLVVALAVWFGVGFVLGKDFKYRHALEVASWSSLISIPAYLLTTALAWTKQTMRGVHVGLGILLPDMDPPSKLHTALGVFLDSLGPLSIWYLVVGILGAAALSGAPRKSVAWVLGILYVVLAAFMAALAAMFTPAA